jgi:hypothetical protein
MWIIRRHHPSKAYTIFFLILFLICLYIIFNDDPVSNSLPPDIIVNVKNASNPLSIKLPDIAVNVKNAFNPFSIKLPDITVNVNNASNVYLHVQLDLTSNTAICRENDYLIIYVLSTAHHVQRRSVLRSTWASKRTGVCFVFVLGQVLENAMEIQMKINNEKKEYQDIVQINHTESYANVVYKEVAALQWSQYFYRNIPYLFKTDDDLIVDTILISSIAHLLLTNMSSNQSFLAKYRPTLITNMQSAVRTTFFRGGWAMDYQPTVRDGGKFGVKEDVWPHPILPAYCSGFGWIMSNNIRDRLVNASYTYPLNKTAWIGDVFVSGFLAKAADVKCSGIFIDYDQTASANCSCLMVNNPMLTVCSSSFHAGGGGTEVQKYAEYTKAWQIIQLRHNSTNMKSNDC